MVDLRSEIPSMATTITTSRPLVAAQRMADRPNVSPCFAIKDGIDDHDFALSIGDSAHGRPPVLDLNDGDSDPDITLSLYSPAIRTSRALQHLCACSSTASQPGRGKQPWADTARTTALAPASRPSPLPLFSSASSSRPSASIHKPRFVMATPAPHPRRSREGVSSPELQG